MPTHPAVIAAVVAGGLGLAGAGAFLASSGDRPSAFGGEGLSIAVVAPTEPVPIDGPVMEVGEVVDGYEHRPFVQPAAYEPDTAWLPEEEPTWPQAEYQPARLEIPEQPVAPPMEPRPDPRPRSRWSFGFDAPLPDFAAERRDRQARMEAMAARSVEASTPAPGPERIDPAARRSPEMFY